MEWLNDQSKLKDGNPYVIYTNNGMNYKVGTYKENAFNQEEYDKKFYNNNDYYVEEDDTFESFIDINSELNEWIEMPSDSKFHGDYVVDLGNGKYDIGWYVSFELLGNLIYSGPGFYCYSFEQRTYLRYEGNIVRCFKIESQYNDNDYVDEDE